MLPLRTMWKGLLIVSILSAKRADEVCSKCQCTPNSAFCSFTILRSPLTKPPEYSISDLIIIDSDVRSVFEKKLSFFLLQRIYVLRSRVDQLSGYALISLKRLIEFEMSHANLQLLFPNVFTSNPSLRRINLSNNNIEEIPSDVFSPLPLITDLHLNYNKLKIIRKGTFASNPKMKRLNISNNRIENIETGAFNFSSVLDLHPSETDVYINLSSNALSEIQNGIFSSCPLLKELDVSHNLIRTLHKRAFEGLDSLRVLDMQDNYLKIIPGNVFGNCTALSTLLLSRNDIKHLHPDSFKGLRRLRVLHLEDNALTDVGTAFQIPLPSLFKFHLSQNNIWRVRGDAFSGCPRLSYLDISHNSISLLEEHAFRLNSALLELYLQNNNIKHLHCNSFYHLSSAHTLNLDKNYLGVLPYCSFTPLKNLRKLVLSLSKECVCERSLFLRLRERGIELVLDDRALNAQCLQYFKEYRTDGQDQTTDLARSTLGSRSDVGGRVLSEASVTNGNISSIEPPRQIVSDATEVSARDCTTSHSENRRTHDEALDDLRLPFEKNFTVLQKVHESFGGEYSSFSVTIDGNEDISHPVTQSHSSNNARRQVGIRSDESIRDNSFHGKTYTGSGLSWGDEVPPAEVGISTWQGQLRENELTAENQRTAQYGFFQPPGEFSKEAATRTMLEHGYSSASGQQPNEELLEHEGRTHQFHVSEQHLVNAHTTDEQIAFESRGTISPTTISQAGGGLGVQIGLSASEVVYSILGGFALAAVCTGLVYVVCRVRRGREHVYEEVDEMQLRPAVLRDADDVSTAPSLPPRPEVFMDTER